MATQKTSQAASVETAETLEAKMKRSLQMKIFFTDVQKSEIALAKAKGEAPEKCEIAGGTIIGRIFEVKEKQSELPNGDLNTSLVAIGEFECVNYATGEVFEAPAAYLPGYYLEGAKAALERFSGDGTAIELAVEVLAVATGKAVPVAYEVRNLIPREADSPMNKLKARLAATKKGLRGLPPPVAPLALDAPKAAPEPAQEPATEGAEG